ncbi:MAG: hypothetical protein HYX20_00970 [Candidatus Yanofskybacteria bacterium]|nr:hypothetical protein [Candidatus Yanofskybacteria bacterium]
MSKDDEPPDWVKCCVCRKELYIAAMRKVKKNNGSVRTAVSKIRILHDGRWVCSDVCFNLAVSPSNESPWPDCEE